MKHQYMKIISCALWVVLCMRGLSQQRDTVALYRDTLASSIDTMDLGIDSLLVLEHIDFLYQRMVDESEDLAEESEGIEDLTDDFEELLSEYELCREQPININSEEMTRLGEMGLLSVFQIEALRRYRKWYGDLLYIEELLMAEGFDEHTVAVIAPIAYCGKSEKQLENERITLSDAITRGKHQLTMNYAQKIEDSEAYLDVNDSMLFAKPNTYYLGSPVKLQVKYSYRFGNKIRFGFVMEKDAGEPLFFNRFSDTTQMLVRTCRSPGFDFYGIHLYVTDIRIFGDTRHRAVGHEEYEHGLLIKDLVLGDYQLSFGQGLTLWSGMSFGKASGGSSVMKRGVGVRPKASANEGKFFRGAAATLTHHDFHATVFYSTRQIDATMTEVGNQSDTLDDPVNGEMEGPALVSAMQETGYHRSLGELNKRHTLRQQVFGGHLAYIKPQLEIGCTVYHTRLGASLELKPSKYNQFFFQGDRLTMAGLDFRWQLDRAVFFGELSMSDNKSPAVIAGITVKPSGYIDFTLMYRNYGMSYQNLFFGAVKESSRGQAEEGFYLGLQCAPFPRWNLLAHCDIFRFKWLTSQVYAPSWGQEYSLKVIHQISHHATMQLRLKSKTKMKNSTDDHVFSYYPISYTRRSLQLQLSYTLYKDWVFSNGLSYSHYFDDDGIVSRGHLLCLDVAYKPEGKSYSFTFRYALFGSDDYNSRISMYENDVLGAFSIPSLYGHGSRVYVLGKLKLLSVLSLYARFGCTVYKEETKMDVKAEVVWKF